MSKEHYVTPEEFDKLNKDFTFYSVGYFARNYVQHRAKVVIDGMRKINTKDPDFVYTCRCDKDMTEWDFGYRDYEVFREASKIMDELIIESRKIDGIKDLNPNGGIPDTSGMSACNCPFNV